jgi:hypothetical protein
VTRAFALALLLLWPAWASAQSAGWEDIMGAADRAWQAGQIADAERLYAAAINLAALYQAQRSYRDAEPFYRRTLAILARGKVAESQMVAC